MMMVLLELIVYSSTVWTSSSYLTVISFFFFSARDFLSFFFYYSMMSTIDADNDDDMGDWHICFCQQWNCLNLIFTPTVNVLCLLEMANTQKKTTEIFSLVLFVLAYLFNFDDSVLQLLLTERRREKKIILPLYEPCDIFIWIWREKKVVFYFYFYFLTDKTSTHALWGKEKKM